MLLPSFYSAILFQRMSAVLHAVGLTDRRNVSDRWFRWMQRYTSFVDVDMSFGISSCSCAKCFHKARLEVF